MLFRSGGVHALHAAVHCECSLACSTRALAVQRPAQQTKRLLVAVPACPLQGPSIT